MLRITISLFALAFIATACGQKKPTESKTEPVATATTAGPVETEKPNTNYKPAFQGQTRVAGVRTTTAIEGKVITDKLKKPWGIAALPDGRFLITQKEGTMRIAKIDGMLSEPITGIPEVDDDGQGGLLGIALDPDFEKNRMVFWSFSQPNKDGNLTAVAKGKLSSDDKKIEGATVIYRAIPIYDGDKHYGSRLVFGRDGFLYVSTGERSDLETRPKAEQLNAALGKIIRITKDGKPAPGNPFLTSKNALPEIYSYGHRNPQGLAMHPVTGDIWDSEMGPKGGDEINLIKAGKHYGWPTIGYGLEYSAKKVGEGITQQEGLEQPVYYWDPVLSPSGMTFYSGNAVPEWENNLFIGGLSSKHICRLVLIDNKVVGEERLLADENQRFRDITQGKDGALYAVTDEGKLYRIGKKQ